MDWLDKISETVKQKGKVASVKAKEMAGVAQLKMQMNTQEELIKKGYQEIGKIYYELYSNMPEEPFQKACDGIRAAKEQIELLQEQMELLKK